MPKKPAKKPARPPNDFYKGARKNTNAHRRKPKRRK